MEADIKNEYHGIKGLNALYRRLSAKHFTAIADLHSVLRSSYLRMRFNLDNFKVAHIDKHRKGKRQLTSQNDKKFVQQPTSFENYAEVLAKLGYPVKLDFTSIFGSEKGDLNLLPETLWNKANTEVNRDIHSDEKPWIGLAPFAAHEGKIYPLPLMERVIQGVIHTYPQCRIFLFGGGEKETEVMNRWAETWPEVCNASAQLKGLQQETHPHEPSAGDGQHGQRQYALGITCPHTRGKYMGRNPSLRRLHGMESKSYQCRTGRLTLPSLQYLWQ